MLNFSNNNLTLNKNSNYGDLALSKSHIYKKSCFNNSQFCINDSLIFDNHGNINDIQGNGEQDFIYASKAPSNMSNIRAEDLFKSVEEIKNEDAEACDKRNNI